MGRRVRLTILAVAGRVFIAFAGLPDVRSRPAAQLKLTCGGEAFEVLAAPRFECTWQSSDAAYVLIPGYSDKPQPRRTL
jgi:hypothetical protein